MELSPDVQTYFIDENGEVVSYAPFLRNGFNYDREAASLATGLCCEDPSLTQQQFKDDADINVIMRRFGLTGQMPTGVRVPSYGDFEGITDFRSALAALDAAEASFMQMPGEVRARFMNDPGLFVDFCSNPANKEEMLKLGLIDAPPAPPAPPPIPPAA